MSDQLLLQVMVRARGGGKTTACIEWVQAGVPCTGYPGWTRILVVPTMMQFADLRRRYGEMEDFAHRVYHLHDWQYAKVGKSNPEVMIDNFEMLLARLPGQLVGVTLTGEAT